MGKCIITTSKSVAFLFLCSVFLLFRQDDEQYSISMANAQTSDFIDIPDDRSHLTSVPRQTEPQRRSLLSGLSERASSASTDHDPKS
jgi:hypothetical protein